MLFEKFGEFDSAEELNRVAAAQLAEGDIDAIYGIAEENGIDREDAEDYIDGAAPEQGRSSRAGAAGDHGGLADLYPYPVRGAPGDGGSSAKER